MASNSMKNAVRQYLASQHMSVDDDWLTGCVEFLSEENNGLNEANIKSLAREQWLLNDLKDICPGSLPANLKNLQKTVLNGRFVLQINSAIDIGSPAYQQYLKLQKINMENVEATTKFEDKISNHRMIKLYLTDGVQEISGIEYKPMRNISCDITPGCKVLLKGPIECRRGMLLLTEASVELLGGEVQEYAVSNSLAGLLSTKLGLPVTQEPEPSITLVRNTDIPTPHTQMPSATDSRPISNTDPRPISTTNSRPISNIDSRPISTTDSRSISNTDSRPISNTDSRPIARVTSIQISEFNDEDIDLDQLESIEAQFNEDFNKEIINLEEFESFKQPNPGTSNNQRHDNRTKRPSIDSTTNQNKKLKSDAVLPTGTNKKQLKIDAILPRTKRDIIAVNTVEDYPNDNDIFFEDEDYLREIEDKIDASENQSYSTRLQNTEESCKRLKYPPEPFVFIKQINDLHDSDKAGKVFKVKGQIIKLLSKLSVGKEGWSLKCTIVDGTGNLDVEFTSDVLSKLVGYTPQEMNQLKKQMATQPELKAKAVEALQKAKDSLQVLYCIIELTILEVPKITKLIHFDGSHVEQLNRRINGL